MKTCVQARRLGIALAVVVAILGAWAAPAAAELERDDRGWFTAVDEDENPIFTTGLMVAVGDQFIAGDNRRYEVVKVEGDTARLKFLGVESLELSAGEEALIADLAPPRPSLGRMVLDRLLALAGRSTATQGGWQPTVCVYATHSDESYEPTDGTASTRGQGGIYAVAQSLKSALEQNGAQVVFDRTVHFPKDAGSYDRSRPTAVRCIQQHRPAALVDVHRDTGPGETYQKTVGGRPVTQVMLVVGRQNPGIQANLAFAKRVKAAVDRIQPGLMRGIFMGRGKYNQDLHPRAILIEVGTEKNARRLAEAGVALFGDAFAQVLGAAGGAGESRSGWNAVAVILVLAILGTGGYLWITTGSGRAALEKVKQFVTTEWANAMGVGRRHRDRAGGERAGGERAGGEPEPPDAVERAGAWAAPDGEADARARAGEDDDRPAAFLAGDDGVGNAPRGDGDEVDQPRRGG